MIDATRSHSEVIRTCGVNVPPEAQDYNSQEYLDWLGTVPQANADVNNIKVETKPMNFRRVVDENGWVYDIYRRWWR